MKHVDCHVRVACFESPVDGPSSQSKEIWFYLTSFFDIVTKDGDGHAGK